MKRQFLIAWILAAITCAADPPPWNNDLTPTAPGSFPPMPPGVLELQVSWKGLIDAGKLRVEFAPHDAKKSGTYVVRSSATSTGVAALLFPYQSQFWSELDPSSLKPRFFHAIETDRKETTTSNTRHFPDRVAYQESNKSLKTGAITRNERAFSFSPVFDIFSAMLHVRSQKLADGDLITLVVCPFGAPYLLHVKVLRHEVHRDRNSIRLSVGMRKINRNTLELLPYKKMKNDATLWLTDDDARVPLELRADIFIGDVRATLTGYQ